MFETPLIYTVLKEIKIFFKNKLKISLKIFFYIKYYSLLRIVETIY